jgi:hypothetical protein
MVRIFGIVFIILLVEAGVLYLESITKSSFLTGFLTNQSLQIMGTMLALNVATASFLVGNLTNLEISLKRALFASSKSEIKQNLLFMVVVFLLDLGILIIIPPAVQSNILFSPEFLSKASSFFLFLLYFYALYELTEAIFSVNEFMKLPKKYNYYFDFFISSGKLFLALFTSLLT